MVEPHGGQLVNRIAGYNERDYYLSRSMKKIYIGKDEALDAEKIAIGSFSPLEGFMCKDEVTSVCQNMRLPDGTVWPIPIILQQQEIQGISIGDEILLLDREDNNPIAVLQVEDIFSLNLNEIANTVFGTIDSNHPGVKRLFHKGRFAIGGKIVLLNRPAFPFKEYELDPLETREIFKKKGWKTVVGFQTRNAPHRAHEYLHRLGMEIGDGLFIHPIIGRKKEGDFDSRAVIEAYQILINNYYPHRKVLLAGLSTSMRYAGPREAVFHAIIRKNYGCTHFMVGRDHAGVGDYYDPYAAHRIFEQIPDLGIQIVKFYSCFYCKKCEGIVSENTCSHDSQHILKISMTQIRNMLQKGQTPPPEIIREEVANYLINNFNLITAEEER
ncbi:sulfate adenylyltransferase [Persephonella sp.]